MKRLSIILFVIVIILYIPVFELIRKILMDEKLSSYNFSFFDFFFISSSINIFQIIITGINRYFVLTKRFIFKKEKILIGNGILYMLLTILYFLNYNSFIYFILLPASIATQLILTYNFILNKSNWISKVN